MEYPIEYPAGGTGGERNPIIPPPALVLLAEGGPPPIDPCPAPVPPVPKEPPPLPFEGDGGGEGGEGLARNES